ncbi:MULTISPECIES: cysteine--1-D-myo-inosityl 2-amino-2-deoxy-alpha-D-glucopyranoside ligase [unclassified Pseudoclavibacter]|uniref:cysteine--1-D-myo-inosityl 2-amino-2-deoxy-alpha-D-glucopyranoside ligase n=1 Tax=unclassified Pseudoclavibacter TaxID=2615177 RepID=UPI001BA6D185|nr:cysteine--1-D-myo-inosityl 2-amino-2-deoxy-alpha-D-glucopyranoside ligase [Pseudoclavibacter sp. Marseille-Q4354]MBS3178051.1 cysteine--1-D-myo-inosityl 2-amino-2-deoxy-alpha-D-glucopyranoside ligase [Pseudoclavibacter sp. Marseille-Q4354]
MRTVPSWPIPAVPSVAGSGGGAIRVFDSASGRVQDTVTPNEIATLYVCGITPYDATHLGHAATYVAFDTLGRAWRDAGLEVRYAQNITDVDDPLLERAAKTGRDWQEIAASQTDLFRSDMAALRVLPPDAYVRVQDSIGETGEAIAALIGAGLAYRVDVASDAEPAATTQLGDVYYDVAAAEAASDWNMGDVSGYTAAEMEAAFLEFGGDPDRAGKRGAFDPLLWRSARAGEPAFESAVGLGRPGWHIECSVIATQTLGAPISVQGGGRDLRFPHHELSAAHAMSLLSVDSHGTPADFARAYTHAGLIAYDGTKMSKSLGNLVLVSRLTAAGVAPGAIRLALLSHHYRSDWEWTDEELEGSSARLQEWRERAARSSDDTVAPELNTVVQRMRDAIADDLDTPRVVAIIDEWASMPPAAGDADIVALVDALLGLDLTSD